MRRDIRERLVLPIALPVGILVVLAAVLFGFSRILLSLSHTAATGTALVVAFSIVVVSAVAASRKVIRPSSLASMVGAIAGVAMLAGGIALIAVSPQRAEGGGGSRPVVHLAAKGLQFDQTTLNVPAGTAFTIVFDNQDAGIQHNVEIFDTKDYSGTPLFSGDLVTGPTTVSYRVGPLDAGTYYFRCVVHPTMTGTITATPSQGGGGGAAVNVVAEGLKFDTAEIDLTADTPSTIHFENKDAGVQHNIAIFQDDTLQKVLFRGDLVMGPGSADYQVPALPPGTYYFHCDVHPTMNGKVVVRASASPTPAATSGSSGAGGAAASPSTVTAEGIRFDTDHIDLPANTSVSLTFTNNDAGTPHNIAIYTDSSLTKALFKGEIVTGPTTVTYRIPALPPGTYYFHCDVHPTMNGSVTVG
jgi:plastocyanin